MKDILSLAGKKAVVIGGGGGIGQSIAKGLAHYGADVAIASRNMDTLKTAATEIEAEIGKKIRCFQVDSTNNESIQALVQEVVKEMGTVHILVNSQGFNKKFAAIEAKMNEWDDMFNVNVRGVLLCCKEFATVMIKNNYGKIINVSSIRGIRAVIGGKGNAGYCTTKGAVDMLTKSLASEWAQYNITVNAIGPIVTETKMMIPIFEANPTGKANTIKAVPMGRLGVPDDNIGPAVFLASDASEFVTGQIIYPDGGMAAVI